MYPTYLLPKSLLILLIGMTSFGSVTGQHKLPELQMTLLEVTDDYSIYQYTMTFPENGAYQNPPPGWVRPKAENDQIEDALGLPEDSITTDTNLLNGDPQWHYLFITNEGKYHSFWVSTSKTTKPLIFQDTFVTGGVHEVLMTGTPIYSPTDKPKRRMQTFKIKTKEASATAPNQIATTLTPGNFPDGISEMTLRGEAPCPGVIPGDTIPLAFSIRNPYQFTQSNQVFEVVLPYGKVNVLNNNILEDSLIQLQLEDEETNGKALINDGRLWRWSLPALQPNEELSLFVDVIVSDTLDEEVINIAYGFRSQFLNSNQTSDDIINIEGSNQSLEIATFNGADSVLSITVNRSRDPNRLEYYPDFIPLGNKDVAIRQRIFFQNVGQGRVQHLKITSSELSHFIDRSSFEQECISCMLSRNFVVDIENPYFPAKPAPRPEWPVLFDAQRDRGILPGTEGIRSRNSLLSTIGYIEANFTTVTGHRFRAGDKITGAAHIDMDGSILSTFDTILTVSPKKFRVPSRFGAKAGFNSAPVPEFASVHLGLFGLIPLCASKPLAFGTNQLPLAQTPDFYLQLEALLNHLRQGSANSGNYNTFLSLDFPVQVRWIPSNPFGAIFDKRLAFSLGLTPSYVLNAKDRIGNTLAEKSGFELYGHGDIGMVNLPHHRFSGFGFRYNLLLTEGVGKELTKNNLQAYVQFYF